MEYAANTSDWQGKISITKQETIWAGMTPGPAVRQWIAYGFTQWTFRIRQARPILWHVHSQLPE